MFSLSLSLSVSVSNQLKEKKKKNLGKSAEQVAWAELMSPEFTKYDTERPHSYTSSTSQTRQKRTKGDGL